MVETADTSTPTDNATVRRLALAGMIGPVVFVVGIVVGGAVTPGYSHMAEPVSQLAALGQPYPWIQMTGFVVFGLGILATGLGLWRLPLTGKTARVAEVLLILAGANMVLTGLLRADPMDQQTPSTSGMLHLLTAMVLFLSVIIAFLVLGRGFSRDIRWAGLARFSVIAGLAAFTFLVIYSIAFEAQPELIGMWQRLFAATLVTWFLMVASRLRRLSTSS